MLNFLPGPLLGTIAFSLFIANTILWNSLLFPVAILKFIIPVVSWRLFCSRILIWIGENWIEGNGFIFWLTQRIEWDIQPVEGLQRDATYFIIANHRSWIDIPVLQKVYNRKVPFLKFFIKKQLFWVPVLGFAWWALDFPFMRRYSREYLKKHPEKRGKDLDTIRQSCEIFKRAPASIINFVEGTRFNEAKHARQKSPYQHLLLPKAGGFASVLSVMGGHLAGIINVTLVYDNFTAGFWDLLTGKVHRIIVRAEVVPVPRELLGKDYEEDMQFQVAVQNWINGLWAEKDILIENTLREMQLLPAVEISTRPELPRSSH
jgi:1-acyl-sn-glycerol-3-phosphate acyltransferase